MFALLHLGRLFRILDDEHVFSAVIGIILTGIHDHADDISLCNLHVVLRETLRHFTVGPRREILLTKDLTVLHQIDRHAVRPAGIGILIFQFGIFQIDIDPALLCRLPFYDGRFPLVSGDNIVLLDLDAVAGDVLIAVLHAFHIDRKVGIRIISELIIPAVVSLFSEVILGRSKVCPFSVVGRLHILLGFARQRTETPDGKLVLAAVIGNIVQTVDDHGDIGILLHRQGGDVQSFCDLSVYLRSKALLPKQLIIIVDRYPGPIRPVRVGILVFQLGIGGLDPNLSVLCHPPLDDRGAAVFAGIHIVTFDLQVAVLKISVFLLIIGVHIIGVHGIIPITALEDPAVAALRAEIRLHVRKVLPCIGQAHTDILLRLGSADIDNRDVKAAAVIGRIALSIHHEI